MFRGVPTTNMVVCVLGFFSVRSLCAFSVSLPRIEVGIWSQEGGVGKSTIVSLTNKWGGSLLRIPPLGGVTMGSSGRSVPLWTHGCVSAGRTGLTDFPHNGGEVLGGSQRPMMRPESWGFPVLPHNLRNTQACW